MFKKVFSNKRVNANAYLKIIKDAEHEDTIDIVRGNGNEYSKYIFEFLEKSFEMR